jgi:hypothetical protein
MPYTGAAGQRRGGGIPLLPIGVGADPEGAREIDHTDPALEQFWRELGRRGLGQRQKDDVGRGHELIDVERGDSAAPNAVERR